MRALKIASVSKMPVIVLNRDIKRFQASSSSLASQLQTCCGLVEAKGLDIVSALHDYFEHPGLHLNLGGTDTMKPCFVYYICSYTHMHMSLHIYIHVYCGHVNVYVCVYMRKATQ